MELIQNCIMRKWFYQTLENKYSEWMTGFPVQNATPKPLLGISAFMRQEFCLVKLSWSTKELKNWVDQVTITLIWTNYDVLFPLYLLLILNWYCFCQPYHVQKFYHPLCKYWQVLFIHLYYSLIHMFRVYLVTTD